MSVSPHFNSELHLIKAHALSLAAAQPRCATSPWKESLQQCHLAITFSYLVSLADPKVAMLCIMPASSTFIPLSCTWEELVHFTCFLTEKEQISGTMNVHYHIVNKMKKVFHAFMCSRMFYS